MAKKTSRLRTMLRVVAALATVLIVVYVLVPELAGVRLSLLTRINTGYLILGIGLEAAFLFAYARSTRAVLPQQGGPGLGTVARINLSTLALSHLVPGGTAAGTTLGYRLLTRFGVRGPDACFALGTQGLGSAVVLNAILWLTLMVSIPLRGFDPRYITAAIIGTVLIGFCIGLVLLLTRGRERTASAMCRLVRRLPFLDEDRVQQGVHRLAYRVAVMRADRPLIARALGWAAAAWLLDAASLGVFVAAFGHRVSPDGLLIAFGLANVLAAIPITPRGLGVVEAVLIPTLIAFGTPRLSAVLGVISYRIISFWAPIPIGGAAYLSLRRKLAPARIPRTRRARAARGPYFRPARARPREGRSLARRSAPRVCL